ncbi:DUF6392 family protein [Serratia oryzae]|uniref:DUF6392 family protein n=1 Tax=Serratia oryzae TaxID=2034155 RepID=UPI0012E0D4CE|nr:DUF6392 family protein [Serratia oryzae]
MTVNINALINSLGKTYKEMLDAELIPYKTPPTGSSGDPDVSLDMAKEGVYLSFKRDGRVLQEVTLRIQHGKVNNWIFPNDLPMGLQKEMTRQWVHENIGEPLRSSPPVVIMKRSLGWTDLFDIKGMSIPVSMQVDYDITNNVRSITFMPTSELRW